MGQMMVLVVVAVVLVTVRVLASSGIFQDVIDRVMGFAPRETEPGPEARRALGASPSIGSAESLELRRAAAIRGFTAIADQYGALRTDIADYINHYALFDASVPTTAAFDTAYDRLAHTDLDSIDVTVLEGWVADLRGTWQRALSHAQRVGSAALGDARQGARAAKLAEKAKRVTGSEFEATLRALHAVLDVLGVVLPQQAQRRLEAGQRPQQTD